MAVRDANRDDIPQIVTMIEDFYAEANFKTPEVNRDKTRYVLKALIDHIGVRTHVKVIDMSGHLVGLTLGERITDLFSDADKALEIMLYVHPSFRGGVSAGKLMLSFAAWTKLLPSTVRVEASHGVEDEQAKKIFAKLGWEPRGTLHGSEPY